MVVREDSHIFFCVKSVNLFGVLVGIAYLCSGDDRGTRRGQQWQQGGVKC